MEVKDFIGDWVVDKDIKIDKNSLLYELNMIPDLQLECCFSMFDAMQESIFRGLTIEEVEKATGQSYTPLRIIADIESALKGV